MRVKEAARRVGIVTALAVGPLMLAASPAFAATVYEGSDYAYNDYGDLVACDKESDGNGVYAEYWTNTGGHGQVWDGNGAASGCGRQPIGDSLSSFRVCEDDWGSDTCSSRVYL